MKREDKYLQAKSSQQLKSHSQLDAQQFFTNNILYNYVQDRHRYYVPAYLRMKCKNLVSLDIENFLGQLNATIIFTVYYGNLPNQLIECLENNIVFRFKLEPPIRLEKKPQDQSRALQLNFSKKEKQQTLTFKWRKILKADLNCNAFWSPMDLIDYVISIKIDPIMYTDKKGQHYSIYLNLMEKPGDIMTMASSTEESSLGYYELAQNKIKVQLTNLPYYSQHRSAHTHKKVKNQAHKRIRQEQQDEFVKKVQPYSNMHFIYPVYRTAIVTFFNMMTPIVILGIINLGIFFQDEAPGKRLLNIGALMVSYIAILPSVRQRVPPSNALVISQILVLAMASLVVLTLAHTIKVRDTPGYALDYNGDALYLVTLGLTVFLTFIYLAIGFGFFYYSYFVANKKPTPINERHTFRSWRNVQCDRYFANLPEHIKPRRYLEKDNIYKKQRNSGFFY